MYSAESVRQAFERALDLASVIGRADSRVPLRANTRRIEGSGSRYELTDLLGGSPAMTALRERLGRYAASEATVLIRGATGTGKELAAQALHSASRRRTRPFVAVNCGAIAESLLESELFGYEDGAFTGSRRGGRVGLIESADGGTLFLDEIGEMPLALQTRLLRVLELRVVVRVGASRPVPVDVRVVAATHCDLAQMVEARQFRLDLYYRLNVLYLALPTLAARGEDLPLLVQHFLKRGGAPLQLDAAALALLRQHSWPGNVRELRNILERLPMFVGDDTRLVDADTLLRSAPELAGTTLPADASLPARANLALPSRRRGFDRASVSAALRQSQGDREAAAKLLGVSRTTLWRWLALQGKSADSA
jgi:transcriptional regulator, propionate catabolism operon regulatory protein